MASNKKICGRPLLGDGDAEFQMVFQLDLHPFPAEMVGINV